MPLERRYKADRLFQTKSLTGMWATDTMYVRVKYLDGNRYAQMFSNGTYFAEMYLMYKKADTVQALKTFVMKLGFLEELIVDGSKYQNSPGTEFVKLCHKNDISMTRTDPESPNQNPAAGLIKEV